MRIKSFQTQSRASGANVHKVLGRSDPIVTRDSERIMESGEMVVETVNASERAALDGVVDDGVALLQFPAGADEPDRYISFTESHERSRIVDHASFHRRDETLSWQRIAPIDDELIAWP